MKAKQTASELKAKGFKLLAMSSGGDMKVQSFLAKKNGKKVHGWWSETKQQYEIQ